MKDKYKDFILSHPYEINTEGASDERWIRKVISEARKEGIIYIPIKSYVYRKIEYCSIDQIESYVRKQIAHMRTQYFNTLRPLRDRLSDMKLKEMVEQLNLFEGEKL